MGMARDLLDKRRDEILTLAAKRGASHVRVFGSVARGDDGPESDIDFLVDMDAGRTLIDLIGFALDVEDLLGRKIDVGTDNGLSPHVKDRVLAEARPL